MDVGTSEKDKEEAKVEAKSKKVMEKIKMLKVKNLLGKVNQ